MSIKTISNKWNYLEEFAEYLYKQGLEGKIRPIPYNLQKTTTLRNQRTKLLQTKFVITCENGEKIEKVGWINFVFELIKKGNEQVGISFRGVRFPSILSYIRRTAVVDVETVEIGAPEKPKLSLEKPPLETVKPEKPATPDIPVIPEVEEGEKAPEEFPEVPETDFAPVPLPLEEEKEVALVKKTRVRRTKA